MVTPEYNIAMPGVFKNAVDWPRHSEDILRVLGSRPVDSGRFWPRTPGCSSLRRWG